MYKYFIIIIFVTTLLLLVGVVLWIMANRFIPTTSTKPQPPLAPIITAPLSPSPTPPRLSPTISQDNLSFQDKMKLQAEADRYVGKFFEDTNKNYPWYNKFPLQTKDYYVYFDLDLKMFIVDLFPITTSSIPVNEQVENFKKEIVEKLKAEGVEVSKYEFQWNVKPK